MSSSLQEIEADIQEHRAAIELAQTLERLCMNRDFRQVVLVGYLEKEAVRIVHLKASPGMRSEELQAACLMKLDSIGCFNQYLENIRAKAEEARKNLAASGTARDELLAEG